MSYLDSELKELDGSQFKQENKPWKVKDAILMALLNGPMQQKDAAQEAEKLERYKLSQKVHHSNEETKFDIDELAMIKKLVLQTMPVLIAGQTVNGLESFCK